MTSKKYDSFRPKRATSIDGFFARSVDDHSREPVFRSAAPTAAKLDTATSVQLRDAPRRSTSPAILGGKASPVSVNVSRPLGSEPPRRRRYANVPLGDSPERTRKQHKPHRWKRLFRRGVVVLGVLVLLGGSWFGMELYKNLAKITGNSNPLSLLNVFHPVPLKSQNGRVNILLAANSADDPGHNGANLTDSIMVISVDTKNNTALMLSIPRDLWVDIPGVGYSKINAAYPAGGMGLLQQIIKSKFGITTDYRALINYAAIRDLVNAVGGITITINSSDPRGIYDPSLDYTTRTC